jgi:hypothetical protein
MKKKAQTFHNVYDTKMKRMHWHKDTILHPFMTLCTTRHQTHYSIDTLHVSSNLQASLTNTPSTDMAVLLRLAGQACTSAHTSFFSRNFSPFTRMRGMYCRTSLLHCKQEGNIRSFQCTLGLTCWFIDLQKKM